MFARTRPVALTEGLAWPGFVATAITLAAGVALHARWLPPALTAVLAAIIALRVAWRYRNGRRVPAWLRLILVAFLCASVWKTQGGLFGREAGSALLNAMLVVKLLETESRRDARLVVTVTCFVALCGFLFDQGVLQTISTAMVVVLIFATLFRLDPGPVDTRRGALLTWAGAREALRYVAFALPFAAVCFVFFPRLSTPMWGAPEDALTAHTGISDRMDPGGISSLALDDTPVMRVTFDGALPEPRDRYWRGLVFWFFDGTSWGGIDALRGFNQRPMVEALGTRTNYDVLLEPTDQRWLFLLDTPLGPPADMAFTGDLQTRTDKPLISVTSYRGSSATQARVQPAMDSRQQFMGKQLPDGYNPRTRELAERWRVETGGDARAIAERALAMFNQDFIYSFEPPLLARDSVDDFLFSTRTGFCEHYASAFTFLMRAAGVPARVVVGFQGGLFNNAGHYLVVRRSDAHAWSEIWIEGEGWIRVDPTAAVAPERVQRDAREAMEQSDSWFKRGWLAGLRERMDLAGYYWNQLVVQFGALRQRNLLERLGIDAGDPTRWSVILFGLGGACLLLAGWLVGWRRKPSGDALDRAWRVLLKRLARAGQAKRDNEAANAYAQRVMNARPEWREPIATLTQDYVRLRYASRQADPTAVATFERAVRAFKPRRAA